MTINFPQGGTVVYSSFGFVLFLFFSFLTLVLFSARKVKGENDIGNIVSMVIGIIGSLAFFIVGLTIATEIVSVHLEKFRADTMQTSRD